MEYRGKLIEKANKSLHIKLAGSEDYLNEEIDIEEIEEILNKMSNDKCQSDNPSNAEDLENDYKYNKNIISKKMYLYIHHIVKKIEFTFI